MVGLRIAKAISVPLEKKNTIKVRILLLTSFAIETRMNGDVSSIVNRRTPEDF